MGKLRKVEIDDKMPCDKNEEPFIPICESLEELWPALLTKAIIKLFSYKFKNYSKADDLIGDVQIINALTGFFAEVVEADKLATFESNNINAYQSCERSTNVPYQCINNNLLRKFFNKIDIANPENYTYLSSSVSNTCANQRQENYLYERNIFDTILGRNCLNEEKDSVAIQISKKDKYFVLGYTYNNNNNQNQEATINNAQKKVDEKVDKKRKGSITQKELPSLLKKEKDFLLNNEEKEAKLINKGMYYLHSIYNI